jgi:hypothetical protein
MARPDPSGRFSSQDDGTSERKISMSIRLYAYVGDVTEEELDFLIDNLEEEWTEDRDYYINRPMVDALKRNGADASLLNLLDKALGNQDEVEILWVDTEELEGDEDEDEEP